MATHSKDSRKNDNGSFTSQIRNILLAGVGAVVLAQEEIEEFISRLVKRGEMAEKDGKKLLSDILARRKKEVSKEVATLETDLSSRISDVLHKVKLVSKKDVDQLSEKIDALAAVVERLSREKRAH